MACEFLEILQCIRLVVVVSIRNQYINSVETFTDTRQEDINTITISTTLYTSSVISEILINDLVSSSIFLIVKLNKIHVRHCVALTLSQSFCNGPRSSRTNLLLV